MLDSAEGPVTGLAVAFALYGRARPLFQVLFYVSLLSATWALGAAIGTGRRRAAALLERTTPLERQREENARRAVYESGLITPGQS